MRKSIILALFFLLSGLTHLNAQDTSQKDFRVWADFFFHYTVNKHYRFIFQSNYKYQVNNNQCQQVIFKPALVYNMSKNIYLQGGILLLYTDEELQHELEFRPWQGMNVFFPRVRHLSVNNLFRLEERFFPRIGDEERTGSVRGRYAVMSFIPINNKSIVPYTLYLWPYVEIYADLFGKDIERFIDKNRFSMGLGYRFSDHIRVETVYLIDRERETRNDGFYTSGNSARLIFRYLLIQNGGEQIGL